VPHAGYQYSGPIAASAYVQLADARDEISRAILIGPSHRMAFHGVAVVDADLFETPLGKVELDQDVVAQVLTLPGVERLDPIMDREHCLEVQLPFLQTVLDQFRIVPLLVGEAAPDEVAAVLDAVWGGDETIVVVSSDLSHYHSYETAGRLDRRTVDAIERLDYQNVGPDDACGCRAIGGMLYLAHQYGLMGRNIDLRNSGDTSGPRDGVVGYGAFVFGRPTSAIS
jgi:AmmeMemoRadiSam system protein B